MRRLLGLLLLTFACVEEPPPLAPGNACDPLAPNRCHEGFCLELEVGRGICTHECSADVFCPPGLACESDGRGGGICRPVFRCEVDEECPIGHRCDAARGACHLPVLRGLCDVCTHDEQCPAGGICLHALATGEQFCTIPCSEGACPSGYRCRDDLESAAPQCVPDEESCEGGRPLCASCEGDAACGDGNDLCVRNVLSGERFCSVSCNPRCQLDRRSGEWVEEGTGRACDSACPEGFSCTDLGGGAGPFQCTPDAGTCRGYCDGSSLDCGMGRVCDAGRCVDATDGRACAACEVDGDCASGSAGSRCLRDADGERAFCAPPCASEAACVAEQGPGFTCVVVDGDRLCVPASGRCVAGALRFGEDCAEAGPEGCVTGACLRFGDRALCTAACVDDDSCGDSRWECCALDADGDVDCKAERRTHGAVCVPSGGLFGASCGDGRAPCLDGYCLDVGAARLCTGACADDADCDRVSGQPGAFVCRSANVGGVEESLCFPAGGGEIGADCSFGPAACAEHLCLKKPSGNVCSAPCEAAGDCPAGWGCEPAETVDDRSIRACLPPTAFP